MNEINKCNCELLYKYIRYKNVEKNILLNEFKI